MIMEDTSNNKAGENMTGYYYFEIFLIIGYFNQTLSMYVTEGSDFVEGFIRLH